MAIAEAGQTVEVREGRDVKEPSKSNPLKRGRFTCIIISVDPRNKQWCGADCAYRRQHPFNPRCGNPLVENGLLQWGEELNGKERSNLDKKGPAGLRRCRQCVSLFG